MIALSAAVFCGCSGSSTAPAASSAPTTTSGAAQTLGSGTASSFVTTDATGVPLAIGFRVSQSALTNLPADDTEIDLPLPVQASTTAFKDLAINWNPHGHPPPGIYDVPHFDFHFYMVDMAARNTISPTDPNALQSPPPDQIPTGYVPLAPQVVPMMGVHWIDPSSPEFNGKPFTATFIYGFYDAKLTFAEPMVTVAYLQSHPTMSAPIALPKTYPYAGKYYPTSYSVSFDATTSSYVIALSGLVKR